MHTYDFLHGMLKQHSEDNAMFSQHMELYDCILNLLYENAYLSLDSRWMISWTEILNHSLKTKSHLLTSFCIFWDGFIRFTENFLLYKTSHIVDGIDVLICAWDLALATEMAMKNNTQRNPDNNQMNQTGSLKIQLATLSSFTPKDYVKASRIYVENMAYKNI